MLPLRARGDLGAMAMKGTPHSPKLQRHWDLTIRLFSVISWTLVDGVLPLCRGAVSVFYSPSRLGKVKLCLKFDLVSLPVCVEGLLLTRLVSPSLKLLELIGCTWNSQREPIMNSPSGTPNIKSRISQLGLLRLQQPSICWWISACNLMTSPR